MTLVPVILDIPAHGVRILEASTGKRYLHCLVDQKDLGSLATKGLVAKAIKEIPAALLTEDGKPLHEFYGVVEQPAIKAVPKGTGTNY